MLRTISAETYIAVNSATITYRQNRNFCCARISKHLRYLTRIQSRQLVSSYFAYNSCSRETQSLAYKRWTRKIYAYNVDIVTSLMTLLTRVSTESEVKNCRQAVKLLDSEQLKHNKQQTDIVLKISVGLSCTRRIEQQAFNGQNSKFNNRTRRNSSTALIILKIFTIINNN